jgi:hypothetical protein
MQALNYIYIIAISVLYYLFFQRLANYVYPAPEYCKLSTNQNYNDAEYKKCQDAYETSKKSNNWNKFLLLIVVAVIGIVASGFMPSSDISNGIGVGSLFVLLYTVYMYWGEMNEGARLAVTGAALAAIMYGSHKLYTGKSAYDILRFA